MRRRKRRKGKDKVVGKENNSIIKHTRIYLSSTEGREAGKPTLCTCSTIKTAGLKVRKGGDEVGCHTLTASLCQKPRPAFSCFKISTTVWCLWRHVQCACNKTPHSVGTVRVVQWKVSGGEGRGGEEEYCFFKARRYSKQRESASCFRPVPGSLNRCCQKQEKQLQREYLEIETRAVK